MVGGRASEPPEQNAPRSRTSVPNAYVLAGNFDFEYRTLKKFSFSDYVVTRHYCGFIMVSCRAVKGALCLYVVQLATQVLAGTQFASHVSVNTPARSFTHGVGDPLPQARRTYRPQQAFTSFRHPVVTSPSRSRGYPRERPSIAFNYEELPRGSSVNTSPPWQSNRNQFLDTIPLLPPSPYKVDSPDPESLWPEGLFVPPIIPPRFGSRRSDADADPHDPYLLEGSEAIAAVARAKDHGELYFHDIPHIESLLANQELRVKNRLKPHILGSIRHTWQFYRA